MEPFGDEWRQTARGIVASLAPWAGKDKRLNEEDWMPLAHVGQSPDEMTAALKTWAAGHNAKLNQE